MWLCDRLGLVHPPETGHAERPIRFYQRAMRYPEMGTADWVAFLRQMRSEEIVWRCDWLHLGEMALSSANYRRVVIPSLSQFTYYIPGRFLRQLGLVQENYKAGIEDLRLPHLTVQTVRAFEREWPHRVLAEGGVGGSTELEERYRSRLRTDIHRRRHVG